MTEPTALPSPDDDAEGTPAPVVPLRPPTASVAALDADQFAAYLAVQGLADNSIRNYRPLFVRWVDWATTNGQPAFPPGALAVRQWARGLPHSRAMLAQARATIGHLCRALDVADVSTAIPLPRKPQTLPKGLARDDAVALARTAETMGTRGLAVLVGLYTAARRSEIALLRWDKIDWHDRTLTMFRPKVRDWHTIPLHPALAAHLEPRRLAGEVFVFSTPNQGHVAPGTVSRWVQEVALEAGVGHVTPHRLRHTALTAALDATGDLRAVQDLAGHTNPATTARYTATSDERMRAATAALDFGSPGR